MPSPFPGMNPYLEQSDVWHDFHERFMPMVAELIGAQVDPAYIVKIDEHVYIHEPNVDHPRLVGRPDMSVTRTPESAVRRGVGTLEAPARVRLPAIDTERLSFVEVLDRRNRQVVTVIELLSPANKNSGPDRQQYLDKRAQLLASPVHLVELDLLRAGPRLPMQDLPDCDYYALVSRAEDRPGADLWPLSIRDRLPTIPIPLRAPDADAALDIQQALDRVYDAARYRTYIYSTSPEPPLSPEDARWAKPFISRV